MSPPFVTHLKVSVSVLKDLHLHTGVAGSLHAGEQLERAPLVLDRIVPVHPSKMLEAENLVQWLAFVPSPVGWLGHPPRTAGMATTSTISTRWVTTKRITSAFLARRGR